MKSENDDQFWKHWQQAVQARSDELIQPRHETIQSAAAKTPYANSVVDTAHKISSQLYQDMEYRPYDRWQPSVQTLAKGKGSCANLTFLQTSLLAAKGLPTKIVGGTLKSNEEPEKHVWNTVNGEVVDPTGSREHTNNLTYEPRTTVNIYKI